MARRLDLRWIIERPVSRLASMKRRDKRRSSRTAIFPPFFPSPTQHNSKLSGFIDVSISRQYGRDWPPSRRRGSLLFWLILDWTHTHVSFSLCLSLTLSLSSTGIILLLYRSWHGSPHFCLFTFHSCEVGMDTINRRYVFVVSYVVIAQSTNNSVFIVEQFFFFFLNKISLSRMDEIDF